MASTFSFLNSSGWSLFLLVTIFGTGLWLTVVTGCIQVRLFPQALRMLLRSKAEKDDSFSPFRALCTALAATVGTGNIAGVAGAICLGGPGAVFWMLVSGFFALAVKFAEATFAVRYQIRVGDELLGGPMYIIQAGLGRRFYPLAVLYCLSGIAASFGIGNMVQVNAMLIGLRSLAGTWLSSTSILRAVLIALISVSLAGGSKSIGRISEIAVPYAAGAYIILCIGVLLNRWRAIPGVVYSIWYGAFSPKAVTGGMIGTVLCTVKTGCSRGIFSNEAGMGTASIAHAGAHVSHCAQQGMLGIIEVFADTFVICTLTALVILSSGVPIPYGTDVGAELTATAFSSLYGPFGNVITGFFLICFAYATILGWSFYGLRCMQFLLGKRIDRMYILLQTAIVILATSLKTSQIWQISELLNIFMVLPNLVVLLLLSPELIQIIHSFHPAE